MKKKWFKRAIGVGLVALSFVCGGIMSITGLVFVVMGCIVISEA